MGVSILHAADLHLGSPLRAVEDASPSLADTLAEATYESFERIISVAIDRDVDFVVLAGDLYDREARSVRATDFLVDQFERLEDANIPCYVVHGNHDPLGYGAEALEFPDNVHVFGAGEVETAYYPDEDEPEARIMGQSYGNRHESGSLYYYYTPEDRLLPNIGVLHTGLDPDGRRYAPCSPEQLSTKEIDYWALGHIHTPQTIDGAPGAYAGIPQGRHVGESTLGGCLLVEVESGRDPQPTFVPTSPIVWRTVDIDVRTDDRSLRNLTEAEQYAEELALDLLESTYADLADELNVPIADVEWEPEGFVCRWRLTGRGELHEALDDEAPDVLADRLRNRLGTGTPFVWTEAVRDRTGAPLPPLESLMDEDEVIRELVALAEDVRDDPERREQLRTNTGEIWEWVDDPDRESVPDDRFALSPERLDELIDRAVSVSIDELATRRGH